MFCHFRHGEGDENKDEKEDGMPTRKRITCNTTPLVTTVSMYNKKTSGKQVTLHIEQGSSKLTVKMLFNHPTSSENESERESKKER